MPNNMITPFPVLTTERLILRQLLESDVNEIFLLRSDTTINKFLGRKLSETPADALKFINSIRSNNLLYWAIEQIPTKQLVGTICLFDFSVELNSCEIGYELLTAYQGKGIMSEAIQAIKAFAFSTLGLKTIDAFTHKDNKHSTKLLEKFGFENTALVDSTNPDLLLYRLLK